MSDNFEVKNDEIKKTMTDIGGVIAGVLPENWGFTLLIFEYGDKGDMFYISKSERKQMIEAMKEFIAKNSD